MYSTRLDGRWSVPRWRATTQIVQSTGGDDDFEHGGATCWLQTRSRSSPGIYINLERHANHAPFLCTDIAIFSAAPLPSHFRRNAPGLRTHDTTDDSETWYFNSTTIKLGREDIRTSKQLANTVRWLNNQKQIILFYMNILEKSIISKYQLSYFLKLNIFGSIRYLRFGIDK